MIMILLNSYSVPRIVLNLLCFSPLLTAPQVESHLINYYELKVPDMHEY
jgi:hypothetical protein